MHSHGFFVGGEGGIRTLRPVRAKKDPVDPFLARLGWRRHWGSAAGRIPPCKDEKCRAFAFAWFFCWRKREGGIRTLRPVRAKKDPVDPFLARLGWRRHCPSAAGRIPPRRDRTRCSPGGMLLFFVRKGEPGFIQTTFDPGTKKAPSLRELAGRRPD